MNLDVATESNLRAPRPRGVLMLAPYFAPQTHAAMFRAHKLAKYLPQHGYKPYVVTTDVNYLYNEDPGLLPELPPEVEIHRVRYVEPTLRGVRMALGGEDRTFWAQKQAAKKAGRPFGGAAPATPEGGPTALGTGGLKALLQSAAATAYEGLLHGAVQVPDEYVTWVAPAYHEGLKLIREGKIDLIYTTGMPYSIHMIGYLLKRETGLPWFADFRDAMGHARRMLSPHRHVAMLQREATRLTLTEADGVGVTSQSYSLVFRDMVGPALADKAVWIPTGLDDGLVPKPDEVVHSRDILFAGEYLKEYGAEFLEVLAEALRHPAVASQDFKLRFIGHEVLNRDRLGPHLARLGLEDRVAFIDHLPQREYYKLLAGARAGILIPGRQEHWWNLFAKMIDYVALRKPVLAIVPDPSEARRVLTEARLGVFLDGSRDEMVARLVRFLTEGVQLEPAAAFCDRFLASRQVADFARAFDRLI